MREKIRVNAVFQVSVEPTATGATIRVGGVPVAILTASSAVVSQYSTLFNGLALHPDCGDIVENLLSASTLKKSGWNDEATGAVEPVVSERRVTDAPMETVKPEQPAGLLAKATDKFKHAFDWMMG